MKPLLPILASMAVLAACTTTIEVPVAPVTLSDAEFSELFEDAYTTSNQPLSEQRFTALIARDDLTTYQLARAYQGRGIKRGIYVRDDPMAFPQCSVLDYKKMEEIAPDHPNLKYMYEDRTYQFDRSHYFPDAPMECQEAALAYAQELAAKE